MKYSVYSLSGLNAEGAAAALIFQVWSGQSQLDHLRSQRRPEFHTAGAEARNHGDAQTAGNIQPS